jgi:hypothetical protein
MAVKSAGLEAAKSVEHHNSQPIEQLVVSRHNCYFPRKSHQPARAHEGSYTKMRNHQTPRGRSCQKWNASKTNVATQQWNLIVLFLLFSSRDAICAHDTRVEVDYFQGGGTTLLLENVLKSGACWELTVGGKQVSRRKERKENAASHGTETKRR